VAVFFCQNIPRSRRFALERPFFRSRRSATCIFRHALKRFEEEEDNPIVKQLTHNGVLIPEPPFPCGLVITVRGESTKLTPKQEEMALAWAKKQGTPYVEDSVFVRNFLRDFSEALGVNPVLLVEEVDFTPAVDVALAEREAKTRLTKEERKAQAAARKAEREKLQEIYGYATVDGERVELANYTVEPSGIFMGRGKHPLRGRWKEGAERRDVTLNLSPDAPKPPGDWKEIVWKPDALWVACWKDKLSGKIKYVWLGDTALVKQEREAQKFDEAAKLGAELERVRAHIEQDLRDSDPKRRMIATACYLIDALCLRVGDEKDPGEADTVGATTLRPEHVTLYPDGTVEFSFYGKDFVRWHKKLELPEIVRQNLAELSRTARPPNSGSRGNNKKHPTRDKPQLFPDIGSRDVKSYLSEVLAGLTAKMFRTHHATEAVRSSLEASDVEAGAPEYEKRKAATLANLEAAILCNHTKNAPPSWPARGERLKERRRKAEERVQRYRSQVKEHTEALTALRQEAREKKANASPARRKKLEASYQKKIERAKRRIETAKGRLQRAKDARGKIKAQTVIATKTRTWNLATSLKSYIDPRVYYKWGQQVEYDVLENFYPKKLRQKFAWVKECDQDMADGLEPKEPP
jgi:DNA topoisomerase-1